MKRSQVSILGGALLTAALAMTIASPASADPIPQPQDIVGVGSDTTQFAVNYLADGTTVGGTFTQGFNASAAGSRIASFDALVTGNTNPIVLKAGAAAITRPDGSGAGKALLFGTTNNPAVNFGRASDTLSAAQIAGGLYQVPFAVDGLGLAVATSTNAPATITPAQMVDIYKGNVTNWNQIGGSSGTIVAYVPQSGSGTRKFFEAQLKAANGGVAVTYGTSIIQTAQEHDSSIITGNPNAVAPFSTGRASFASTIKIVNGAGSFSAKRALYNVVRTADLTKPWFAAVFGPAGFVCSGSGASLIGAAGFTQLAGSDDGGVCGIATQSEVTNLTTL